MNSPEWLCSHTPPLGHMHKKPYPKSFNDHFKLSEIFTFSPQKEHFLLIQLCNHRSVNIRFVSGGAKSNGCEIGSKSILSLQEISNL